MLNRGGELASLYSFNSMDMALTRNFSRLRLYSNPLTQAHVDNHIVERVMI